MNFADVYAEHTRICILRFLAGGTYSCNDSILHDILVKKFFIKCSREMVRSQLTWLQEQMLVTYEVIGSGTYLVTITQRGLDVAGGNIVVPGVKRPSPGELHG